MLTTSGYVVVPIIIAAFLFFIGYSTGKRNRGRLLYDTTSLSSDNLFQVISKDNISTVLETVSPLKERVFISTEVFGGKSIRPKDEVRMMGDPKKMKELGIPVLGYPPLVKTSEFLTVKNS